MSRYVALCHVMSRHVTSTMSRHVTSCHVMSRHVTSCQSCHVMPHMPHHATSCTSTSWHVMSHHVISRNVTSCLRHVMSHLAPSCHVMSYHVTSYHVESRGTVTRPTLPQLTSSTRNRIQIKHDRVRWLSRRLPIQCRISGISSSIFL